jgi:hypothetical protein
MSGSLDLPGWVGPWCTRHLGAPPVALMLRAEHLSAVFGLRLADGRDVVVKARSDDLARAASCVAAQRALARGGFRCPAPLTAVSEVDGGLADSLAWMPECVLVGSAAGVFVGAEVPTLAPVDSSAAFIEAYQAARGRAFSVDELELAWAASVWTTTHNARAEALLAQPPVANTALQAQAAERLARAHA